MTFKFCFFVNLLHMSENYNKIGSFTENLVVKIDTAAFR